MSNGERYPLSFGQEQLWFLNELAPTRTTYHAAVTYRMTGSLDLALLRASLTNIVRRHEVLRSTVHAAEGMPYAMISAPTEVALNVVELADIDPGRREAAAADALAECINTPFDLGVGPLYRFTVIRLAPTEYLFSQVYHHILADDRSIALVNAELATTYAALHAGMPVPAEPPPLQYADHARQQRDAMSSGELDSQLEYWQERLADLPMLELPADRGRPAEKSFAGNTLAIELPDDLRSAVVRLTRQQGVSLNMLLATAVAVLLARYTGQEDISLGISTSDRIDPALEGVIGFFTNIIVLRVKVAADTTFADLMDQVTGELADGYDNQDVPFELVVDRVQPVRDLSRNPLFVVAMELIAGDAAGLQLPGVRSAAVESPNQGARFDLALNFVDTGGLLSFGVEYSTDLFDSWRIEALAEHLSQLLASACADPDQPVSRLPIVAESERRQLLAAGRGASLSYGPEPVHAIVARTAATQPDHPAAVFEGREMSYAELDRRAAAVARYLRASGIEREQIVAIIMERDLDAVTALLGVLKAGAAFAVLDPNNPLSRLEYMLRDTATPLVLTQSRLRGRLPESDAWRIVMLDDEWSTIESVARSAEPLVEWASRDSLAYVLYTSGSTGQPKGVLIEHRALISFVESYRRIFDLDPADRMLQLAALSFDMSQGEIFAGLCAGSTLVLVDQEAGASPDALAALMRDQRTSYICMSPAMLSLVEAEPLPDLRKIMAGGDAMPAELVTKWNLPGRRLINVYGPTEAAVGCTAYECPHEISRSMPPIGVPLLDRRMYVVDGSGNLVPRGIPGELLIGGEEGLARGYLNQPELTAASFIEDPFHTGGRVYRSGDLVRWNREYQLEFLGRVDSQVKLRGLRIELEEIESALLGHPDVSMAAVALRKDRRGESQLVGYVTPAGDRIPEFGGLTRYLKQRLPDYMIPTAWVALDRLPLTTARKVNRAALPDPAPAEAVVAEFLEPVTATEKLVAEIFATVLADRRVGAESSFFEEGGNSLLALRLISALNREFGIKFTLRWLFSDSTVRGVAAVVEDLVVGSAPVVSAAVQSAAR